MEYVIQFTNGNPDLRFKSHQAAIEYLSKRYPNLEVAEEHDRTVAWRSEEAAKDDSGLNAICTIYPVKTDAIEALIASRRNSPFGR